MRLRCVSVRECLRDADYPGRSPMKRFSKSILVLTVAASLLHCSFIPTAFAGTLPAEKPSPYPAETQVHPAVTAQPDVGPDLKPYFNDPSKDPELPPQMLVTLLRQRIKYVFIIFNENHSFDNEYGTFPGVNGIYSDGLKPRSAAGTPGFTQTYTDVSGVKVTVQPFRIGPAQNSSVVDSVDHSHPGLAKKIHMVDGVRADWTGSPVTNTRASRRRAAQPTPPRESSSRAWSCRT